MKEFNGRQNGSEVREVEESDMAVARFAQQQFDESDQRTADNLQAYYRVGRKLQKVKDRLGTDRWMAWVDANDLPSDRVSRALRIAKYWGNVKDSGSVSTALKLIKTLKAEEKARKPRRSPRDSSKSKGDKPKRSPQTRRGEEEETSDSDDEKGEESSRTQQKERPITLARQVVKKAEAVKDEVMSKDRWDVGKVLRILGEIEDLGALIEKRLKEK